MSHPSDAGLASRLFTASPEATLALLRAAWSATVGPELDRRTEVVALDRGILRVRVPDAGWRRGLARMRGDILSRLGRIAGGLAPRSLAFVEGPVPERVPEREAPRERAPAAPSRVVVEAAAAIPDPDLRARFLKVAEDYLRRFGPERLEDPPSAPGDTG
jgi:hypothetical protein